MKFIIVLLFIALLVTRLFDVVGVLRRGGSLRRGRGHDGGLRPLRARVRGLQ